MRRAARYLAISSKKSMCVEEEGQSGRELVDREPRRGPGLDIANPFASVSASSWAAVLPASRMWYPDTEIGCQRGISAVQKRIVSATIRIDGRGGKMNSFCAWYSLRMSFWRVPPKPRLDAAPLGHVDVHRQQDGGRRVDRHGRRDLREVDLAVEVLHVGERVDGDAALAHLAQRQRVVRVAAHEGGQVERGRQPVAAVGQQLPEPPVGVGRGAEAANMRIVQSFDRYIEAYGPRYTATRRGTRRRPGRRRARPAAPTWCRSRPPAARPARARPASGRVPSSPRQRYRLS